MKHITEEHYYQLKIRFHTKGNLGDTVVGEMHFHDTDNNYEHFIVHTTSKNEALLKLLDRLKDYLRQGDV